MPSTSGHSSLNPRKLQTLPAVDASAIPRATLPVSHRGLIVRHAHIPFSPST